MNAKHIEGALNLENPFEKPDYFIRSLSYTKNQGSSTSSQTVSLVNAWGSRNTSEHVEIIDPSFHMLRINM